MKREKFELNYTVYNSITELNDTDEWLLSEAREVTKQAYAPYSMFHVGAVAKLVNGEMVTGSNQENASFPAGLCAERVLLGTAATLYPGVAVATMAISMVIKEPITNL
jgi:cytidine deaminase